MADPCRCDSPCGLCRERAVEAKQNCIRHIAQLRHLYDVMVNGAGTLTPQGIEAHGKGLLGKAIEGLEKALKL